MDMGTNDADTKGRFGGGSKSNFGSSTTPDHVGLSESDDITTTSSTTTTDMKQAQPRQSLVEDQDPISRDGNNTNTSNDNNTDIHAPKIHAKDTNDSSIHNTNPEAATTTSSSSSGFFTLLLFATAATYTGHDELRLPAPTTLPRLFRELEDKFPGFGTSVLRSAAVSVNLEYVDFDFDFDADMNMKEKEGGSKHEDDKREGGGLLVIRAGDEVGIIPPVSSG